MTTDTDIARLQQFALFSGPRLDKLEDDVSGLRVVTSRDSPRVSDHETRIRQMKTANVKLAALVGALSTIGSFVAQYFMSHPTH